MCCRVCVYKHMCMLENVILPLVVTLSCVYCTIRPQGGITMKHLEQHFFLWGCGVRSLFSYDVLT